MAWTYSALGVLEDAESHATRALEIRRAELGPEHPDTLEAMEILSVVWTDQGRYEEAVSLGERLVESRRRVLGADHQEALSSVNQLGIGLYRLQRFD